MVAFLCIFLFHVTKIDGLDAGYVSHALDGAEAAHSETDERHPDGRNGIGRELQHILLFGGSVPVSEWCGIRRYSGHRR